MREREKERKREYNTMTSKPEICRAGWRDGHSVRVAVAVLNLKPGK